MAPWTTLWLPENAEISAAWLDGDKDETVGSSSLDREKVADADLEDVVRDVRRYGSVYDLLDELADHPRGTFNVVYPDPSFSGCDEVVRNSDKTDVDLPFVPAWETMGTEEDDPTPLNHWWFAFMAARVEYGPFSDMSLIYDEGGDLVPEGAADDTHRTQKKLKWARSVYADSRKFRFSIYWGIHYEENLHHTIRRECERWIQMPDKSPNPVKRRSTTHPLGMDKVPMFTDLMSHRDKGGGTFLIFDESEFDLVSWYLIDALDRTTPGEGETDAWLKIVLEEPETDEPETPDEPTLHYDSSVFKVWTAPDERRLYAKDPHQGYVDLMSGLEVEPLQYDGPEYTFEGVEEDDPGDYLLVQMRNEREGGLVTAARIPIDDTAAGSGIGLEDENDDRDGEVSV